MGIKGHFFTLSQCSDPAAQDVSADEDRTVDRTEEYQCVQASLSCWEAESILLV